MNDIQTLIEKMREDVRWQSGRRLSVSEVRMLLNHIDSLERDIDNLASIVRKLVES